MKHKANQTGVGTSLRKLREHAGLTLKQAADAGRTSYAYLSRVETGTCAPSAAWIHGYVDNLGAHLAEKDAAA